MNKLIILFLFLSIFIPLKNNAQTAKAINDKPLTHRFYLGASASINYSQVNLRKNNSLFSKTVSSKINRDDRFLGWNAAITAKFQVSKKLSFLSGLGFNYVQSGASRSNTIHTPNLFFGGSQTVSTFDTIVQNIYQLEIPFLINVSSGYEKVNFYIETGIVFLPIRWGNGQYSFSNSSGKNGSTTLINIVNLTAVFNFGIQYLSVNKIHLGFGWVSLSAGNVGQKPVRSTVIRLGYTYFFMKK